MDDVIATRRLRLLPGAPEMAPDAAGQSASYAWLSLPAPRAGRGLCLELVFASERTVQLPLYIYDGGGRLRLSRASEPSKGAVRQRYEADSGATPGAPGATPGGPGATPGAPDTTPHGEWKLVLQKRILSEALDVEVTARETAGATTDKTAGGGAARRDATRFAFSGAVPDPRPGWYCGELHLHSDCSTGRTDVATIRRVAIERHIDFLSLTDHITDSHWPEIQALSGAGERPLFLQSLEVAGERGHANLHGVQSWPDPFPDDSDGALSAFMGGSIAGSIEEIADRAHAQGALVGINHPLSASVPWRYADLPMEKADLIEIASLPDGTVSFLYPTLWDRFLCAGLRITGVGSSDSHDPLQDGPWALGRILTWVRADSLSRRGILDALKAGRAYVALGGSRLEFDARVEGRAIGLAETRGMGETLDLEPDQACILTVTMAGIPPGNLFVMKDGLLHEVRRVIPDGSASPDGGSATLRIRIEGRDIRRAADGRAGSFVRVEYHEEIESPRYHGMASRDHRSLRLASNPIWLRATTRGTPP